MLEPEQHAALTSLRTLWPHERIVLIGATALRLQTGLQRETHDMDLVIAVDVADFPGPLTSHADWAQPLTNAPQRWTYRKGTRLDLLPVGARAIAQGDLQWPNGVQMSVQAFDLLSSTELLVLLEEQQVLMAPVPLLMLLKMVAWLDRPAERARDVEDMVWLFSNYPDDANDEEFARLVSYGFDEAGRAELLGMDIARIEDGRDISRRFLHQLETSYGFQYAKARRGLHEENEEGSDQALAAFKRGLGIA